VYYATLCEALLSGDTSRHFHAEPDSDFVCVCVCARTLKLQDLIGFFFLLVQFSIFAFSNKH